MFLLDDDDDNHDVEEDEEDPGGHVGDGGEAAAEQWSHVKDGRTTEHREALRVLQINIAHFCFVRVKNDFIVENIIFVVISFFIHYRIHYPLHFKPFRYNFNDCSLCSYSKI